MRNYAFGFLQRIKKDNRYRIKLFLRVSFILNIVYSAFLLIISQVYLSKWFLAVSFYYALLAIVRVFLFTRIKSEKTEREKIKTIRVCGYFLFLINGAISVMMFLLIRERQTVTYHEITVITLATYTFSALTVAIVSSIKFLREKDRLYACVKIISLVSANVSIVTLTNTMLATFGEGDFALRSIILPLISGFVAVFIIVSAIIMIRKANLYLRIFKNEEERK